MHTLTQLPHNSNILGEHILQSFDRLLSLFNDLSSDQINWRLPVAGSNSLYSITLHALAAAEETADLLNRQPSSRNSQEEFAATGSPAQLLSLWSEKRHRMVEKILNNLPEATLQGEYVHPRRAFIHPDSETITGSALLLRLLQHINEHLGQAQIMCDLLKLGEIPCFGVW